MPEWAISDLGMAGILAVFGLAVWLAGVFGGRRRRP